MHDFKIETNLVDAESPQELPALGGDCEKPDASSYPEESSFPKQT